MDELIWNSALQRMNGHLLQSWRWGEFKQRQGWTVERLRGSTESGEWMAQVLFKSHGPLSVAYVPNGPTLCGDHEAAFADMMAEIDRSCRRQKTFALIMEPTQRFELKGTIQDHGMVASAKPIQPRKTLSVPILDDDSALRQMHHKTRYHIRLASRQGAVVRCHKAMDQSIATFYKLHEETVRRNGIKLLPRSFFLDLCETFGSETELLIGERDGVPVAAAIMTHFGEEAHYLFAGSSTEHRGQGAGALVVFKAMQWARDRGCCRVNLGSIENEGLRTFKTGFGGVINDYMPTMERRYHPVIAWLVRSALTARAHL